MNMPLVCSSVNDKRALSGDDVCLSSLTIHELVARHASIVMYLSVHIHLSSLLFSSAGVAGLVCVCVSNREH